MSASTRGYERDVTLTTKGRKLVSVDRIAARRIGPRTLGSVSIVMSTACLLSISFPYKTFAFVPPVLFPWHYSPGRLWLLGAAWAVFTLVFAMSAAV
jgi:hypothetical protein